MAIWVRKTSVKLKENWNKERQNPPMKIEDSFVVVISLCYFSEWMWAGGSRGRVITVLRSLMFSRRAPMHPQNVMKNMTTPTTIRMTAGSMKNVSRTVSARERGEERTLIYTPVFFSAVFPAPALWILLIYRFISWGLCKIPWQNHWNEPSLIPFIGIYCRLQFK